LTANRRIREVEISSENDFAFVVFGDKHGATAAGDIRVNRESFKQNRRRLTLPLKETRQTRAILIFLVH